ncbi:Uncharacterized protein dnl_51080 [Desulfonema limicola]|uniref:Uncharacterized protein n=1 Tax=Desulfonema limicola TaxID=45656 RepID=A0A975BC96_9BACT|nr:Uncharacterized protein dnl_51080 [Desulfonema limicola]
MTDCSTLKTHSPHFDLSLQALQTSSHLYFSAVSFKMAVNVFVIGLPIYQAILLNVALSFCDNSGV